VDACFDLRPYLKNVDYIFKRAFAGKGKRRRAGNQIPT